MKLTIIVADFNARVTHALLDGATARAKEKGIDSPTITHVPGAVELPLAAQWAAQSGDADAIIVLGAVIKGETDHYDYVCQQVSFGTQEVALKYNIPVIFGVLTTQTAEQAIARTNGEHSNKGSEAVDCALVMLELAPK